MDDKEIAEVYKNFRIAGLFTIVVLAGGTVFYHFIEKLSYVDALYFSVITLTTVGYGDISPQTQIGKLFTVGYVLVGIAIIGTFANLLLKRSMAKRHESQRKKQAEKEI